ncbi:MAG: histidine phosphatase family protein [Anaerolineales bacterium]
MKWYIIRHGDKEKGDFYNPVLRHQDQPISAKGRAEAENLVPYFTDKTISKIYVSEYIRTMQTIRPVAEKLKLTPIVDSRLNELAVGLIEGLSPEEINEKFPDLWEAFRGRDRDFQFPEGETGEQVLQRMQSFIAEKLPDDEDIIIMAHDGWIRILACHILDIPVYQRWDFVVDTCGIMEIEYESEYEHWMIVRFNHICS